MLCADVAEMREHMNRLWRMGQNWSRIVAEASAALMCEAMEAEADHPLTQAEIDAIRVQWQPQQGCDRQCVQLCRAVSMRESVAPSLSAQPINRARSFLANSFHRPGIPLYAAAREAFLCETAARRMAMDSATRNAGQMIDRLKLQYNRARQGAITQELTEIISGAEALN